jgi:indoleamine 2,3-dioxygenase
MVLLSYFGHACVWGDAEPVDTLPAPIAVPWHAVAERLGRPPVLSYASYALDNWRRFDPAGPIALGNIALRQNFLGGLDEEWFVLVHVQIEAEAASALAAIEPIQRAVRAGDADTVQRQLNIVHQSLRAASKTLNRMPEGCDPYIYYRRVRPYIHGWKDHPALPEGVIYEGVDAYGGRPQAFRGETGAQSGIVPAMDAVLSIEHKDNPLRPYLMEMREYMPPEHRGFLERIEQGPSLRRYVLDRAGNRPELRDAYNEAVAWLGAFRNTHIEYARAYIARQAGRDRDGANPRQVGTGGTPFIDYLQKHHDETLAHRIR